MKDIEKKIARLKISKSKKDILIQILNKIKKMIDKR